MQYMIGLFDNDYHWFAFIHILTCICYKSMSLSKLLLSLHIYQLPADEYKSYYTRCCRVLS